MESRILLYIAIGVIVAIIGVVAVLPNSDMFKNMAPHNQNTPSALTAITTVSKPIQIEYNGTKILSANDRNATMETKFTLTNPNDNTLIIEMVSYDIYYNDLVIGHGQYGQRYEGTWQSSYYLPLTQHNTETISNDVQIQNDGNNPQFWSSLQAGQGKFKITGTIFYSTNTAFSGQGFSKDFAFP